MSVRDEGSPYNGVSSIFVNSLCRIVDSLCGLVDFPRRIVGPLSCFSNLLRVVAHDFCSIINPIGVLVNVLLYRCLPKALDSSCNGIGSTNLVVCDGASEISGKTVQGVGVISVVQELHKPVFFR